MPKIQFDKIFKGCVLFSSATYLVKDKTHTIAKPPLVDINFIKNGHKKLIDELKSNTKATLFVGEEHESLRSLTAHVALCKSIKNNNLTVSRVYLELDDASLALLSPARLPVTYVLMQAMIELFGPVVGGGLCRLYSRSMNETDLMEKDLFDKCTSQAADGLTIAFVGINHIYGLKKLSQQHKDKKIIAVDHSFVSPKNYEGYQHALLSLAQLNSDYSVDPDTKLPSLKSKL
jgi:hypothetical protein